MRLFRRSLIALGVAAMLPTLVFMAVGIFMFLRAQTARVEAESLARSSVIMTLLDSSLRGDAAALSVLSSSVLMETEDWARFYPRLQRAARANPHWATVSLYDVRNAAEILDLRRPLGAPRHIELTGDLQAAAMAATPTVGSIQRDPEPMVFVFVPVIRKEQHHILAAGIKAQTFQDILLAHASAGSISAIVDRTGRFIARSLDYQHRVGTPATTYVREALQKTAAGVYRGRTYEGVENYTAFASSAWTGWSAHVAIASALIDVPTSWSFIVATVAVIGSALLGATLVITVLRDMSERRRSEDTLRQSQKMEAVGQLTGGIAHDFNNLLTAIIGNLDMLRTRAGGQERLQRLADNALEAAHRGAKLTSQLLAFSRRQRMQVQPVDLQQLVDGMSSLLTQCVGPAVDIQIDLAPDARLVMSDPNQLELAILNLAVNARDAMPQGGSLAITARLTAGPTLLQLRHGAYICVSVRDTGVGMRDEVLRRAAEPFFTTKPLGEGTGLGLSQVYGIVRESGGGIDIVSAVNAGTTVHLYLPRSEVAPAMPPASNTATISTGIGTANILVVDDDAQVREFLVQSLRDQGYRVTEASDGGSALTALATQAFALMIVDFAMPQMNGAEVVRAARSRWPTLRVLMVSGYADSAEIDTALGEGTLLRKPFDAATLGAAVRRCLAVGK